MKEKIKVNNSKLVFYILAFCMLFLFGCSTNTLTKIDKTYKVVALGDSISAGYAPTGTELYNDYNDYVSKKTDINVKCYTQLFSDSFLENYTRVEVVSHAQSGDTSTQLVTKFEPNDDGSES